MGGNLSVWSIVDSASLEKNILRAHAFGLPDTFWIFNPLFEYTYILIGFENFENLNIYGLRGCKPALHVDTCNVPGSKNFAVGLGSYAGGELFVEAPGGCVPFLDNATGEWLWGEKRALNLEPVRL